MKKDLQETAVEFAQTKMSAYDAGHDWQHIERVRRMARHIQHKEKAGDPDVVELAAILHDIADSKFRKEDAEDSGTMAYNFLMNQGLDSMKAETVRNVIDHISFSSGFSDSEYDSMELQIVQDADRLDAMGAIGIARAFNYGGYKNRSLYDPGREPAEYDSPGAYRKSDAPTLNHFYEKLFLLKDLMNTRTGREIARERHDFMVAYVEQFKKEWTRI